jgi:hypothetical protein
VPGRGQHHEFDSRAVRVGAGGCSPWRASISTRRLTLSRTVSLSGFSSSSLQLIAAAQDSAGLDVRARGS